MLVEQEIRNTQKTALNTVLETDVEREELLKEEERLSGIDTPEASKRIAEIYKRLEIIEANKA